jgi:hypothetical protein
MIRLKTKIKIKDDNFEIVAKHLFWFFYFSSDKLSNLLDFKN